MYISSTDKVFDKKKLMYKNKRPRYVASLVHQILLQMLIEILSMILFRNSNS